MILCNAIAQRRSTRIFNNKCKIETENILNCIEAAMKAPSSYNIQPWRFRIIESKDVILKLAKELTNNRWLCTAPTVVVVGVKNTDENEKRNYLAIGAAIENFLLEAQQREIATCWIGITPENHIEEFINDWPAEYKIVSFIAVGYGRKYPMPATNRKDISEILI